MTKGEMKILHDLIDTLSRLACEIHEYRQERHTEFEWFRSHHGLVTKHDLEEMEKRIMSAISTWAEKVAPKLDRIQTGLDAVQALVEQLQNTSGAITPEDQALLDQIEAKVNAIATDADSVTPPPTT